MAAGGLASGPVGLATRNNSARISQRRLFLDRRSWRDSEHRSLLIPMALIVQPIIWSWLSGYRPADFQSQRYIAALNPLYLLVGVTGGWWILSRLEHKLVWVRVLAAAAIVVGSLAMQPASAATYALNVKNITEMQVTIARWIRNHTPRGSLLAVNDVGAVGVITDDPVLDLQGLVTTQVLPLRSMGEQVAGRAPALLSQFVFDHRPDYLIIFPRWYPEMDQRRDVFSPVFEVQLRDNITSGSNTMVVYRSVWAGTQEGRRHPPSPGRRRTPAPAQPHGKEVRK